jgi:hypothetical protein
MGDEAFVPPFPQGVERKNLSTQLHVWHIPIYLANLVDAATVNVFIGVISQEVANGSDSEFVGEQQGTIGTYALQILDILAKDVQNVEYFSFWNLSDVTSPPPYPQASWLIAVEFLPIP